jgi:VCBS repeat-containing protein
MPIVVSIVDIRRATRDAVNLRGLRPFHIFCFSDVEISENDALIIFHNIYNTWVPLIEKEGHGDLYDCEFIQRALNNWSLYSTIKQWLVDEHPPWCECASPSFEEQLEQQRIVRAATCALVAVSNPLLEAAMSHAKASHVLPDAAALLAAFDTFALVSEHVQALSPVAITDLSVSDPDRSDSLSVTVNAGTGAFTYTPTATARHAAAKIGATSATTDTFTVTVTDGYGAAVPVAVTVAISPKNTAPVAGT